MSLLSILILRRKVVSFASLKMDLLLEMTFGTKCCSIYEGERASARDCVSTSALSILSGSLTLNHRRAPGSHIQK
jgi:hypothetical protein